MFLAVDELSLGIFKNGADSYFDACFGGFLDKLLVELLQVVSDLVLEDCDFLHVADQSLPSFWSARCEKVLPCLFFFGWM